jgi:hypothetical protein
MPAPGAGGVQTSLVGTVQGMMASARAAFRRKPGPTAGAPIPAPRPCVGWSRRCPRSRSPRRSAWYSIDPGAGSDLGRPASTAASRSLTTPPPASTPTPDAEHATTLLAGYRGIVQCDGYAAYKQVALHRAEGAADGGAGAGRAATGEARGVSLGRFEQPRAL